MILLEKDIPDFTRDLLASLGEDLSIVTLTGPLGAGKTTLVRQALRLSRVTTPVTSPTFGYVKSYIGEGGIEFHHFDLYRITSLEAFVDAGFDEYLTRKKSICFIEWPEIIEPLLTLPNIKKKVVNIAIDYDSDDKNARIVVIAKN